MRELILSITYLVLSAWPLLAAVCIRQAIIRPRPYRTGYFGGLRFGTIFKLLLSRQGGAVFYRIAPEQAARLAKLQLNTPVRIQVDKGLVTCVAVQKGEQWSLLPHLRRDAGETAGRCRHREQSGNSRFC